jgi:LmbE family N-acetylglucosaminyl deacetylase
VPVKDPDDERPVVLHVSPHPDDEAIAAGMTLHALAVRGWSVVNLLLSAGRPGEEERRRAEAADAAARGGYRLELAVDALAGGAPACTRAVIEAIERFAPVLVVCPQPRDGHPSHELVGSAVVDALAAVVAPPVCWWWGLWAALKRPTLYVAHGDDELRHALDVLAAYRGEIARNDYHRLVEGLAAANAVLGSERVFGHGSGAASACPYAELFTELIRRDGRWYAGKPRMLDLDEPVPRALGHTHGPLVGL